MRAPSRWSGKSTQGASSCSNSRVASLRTVRDALDGVLSYTPLLPLDGILPAYRPIFADSVHWPTEDEPDNKGRREAATVNGRESWGKRAVKIMVRE